MKKTIAVLVLSLCMMLLLSTVAFASDDLNTGDASINYMTEEEYITMYAEKHDLSYAQAETEVLANNQRLITEYYMQNNRPMPRAIDFYDGYPGDEPGTWYYYADVYDTYYEDLGGNHDIELTYHVYGLVLHDAHSDVFLGDESDWENDTLIELESGNFTFENENIYVNLESPTTIFVRLTGTLQIETEIAANMGLDFDFLLSIGFTESSTNYLRCSIRESFRETL